MMLNGEIAIDIIILSFAKNNQLRDLTEQTIRTCLASENQSYIRFNILVIESNKSMAPFQYEHTTTIYPTAKFGFNRYLNIGLAHTTNQYVCFCNNDLIFHKHWASEILEAMKLDPNLLVANTYCPIFHADKTSHYEGDINYGYQNGIFFTGWCFLAKRSVFAITGNFDEKFEFWFSDDDFRLTLEQNNIRNAIVTTSKVTHLRSETLDQSNNKKKTYLQYSSFAYYKYKWQHHNFLQYLIENLKYKIKIYLAN